MSWFERPEKLYPLLGDVKVWDVVDEQDHVERLRGVVITYPGGAAELWLEHWRPGDEADPWLLVERARVKGPWVAEIELLEFDDEGLRVREVNDAPPESRRTWVVRAAPGKLGTKALKA